MSLTINRADVPAIGIHALKAAPVVIATDGFTQSDPALIAGRLLAENDAAAMRVVTADSTSRIADVAHEANASLIVVGIGRHGVMDRVFGAETALGLARIADVPVLAVAKGHAMAPRHVVVAVDFSETSLRAARLAVELAAPDATIYLVHVEPRDDAMYGWEPGGDYRNEAAAALAQVRDGLNTSPEMTTQRVVLYGDPRSEVLRFASTVRADLIATGSRGRGVVARMLVGSVATQILRGAACSVLTVPLHAVMVTDQPFYSG